ncbi:MAG: hypothetical protein JXM69_16930 [Anaerolineae bacterium]|nr:hypothetical protein [Anaerolineae bacterium]
MTTFENSLDSAGVIITAYAESIAQMFKIAIYPAISYFQTGSFYAIALQIPVFEIDQIARDIKKSKDFHGNNREVYGIA